MKQADEYPPLDPDVTTEYEYQQGHLSLNFNALLWYQSVVAVSVFNSNGDVREIKLYPVDMGYKRVPMADSGVPRLAPPKMAQTILHRLQRLSQPFGTHIEMHGSVGVIRVTASG